MAEVWIPPLLQKLTSGSKQIQVDGATVRQILNNLEILYPGLKSHLYDEEEDQIMPGTAVIVDGEVSGLGLMQPVTESSEVHFLPAIGGGET